MSFIHQELSQGKWQRLALAQQLGNIGSELTRAQSWNRRGKTKNRNESLTRALELIDLTLDSTKTEPQLKEVARLREVVASLFLVKEFQLASFDNLAKFYLPFAMMARVKK